MTGGATIALGVQFADERRMLNSIQLHQRPNAEASTDVVDLLTACHERIRRFTNMAARLGSAPAGTDEQDLAQTASAVHRYFTVALPLHVLDEDLSIAPRLAGTEAPALDRMSREHDYIEAAIAGAVPLWLELATHPARLEDLRASLARVALELDGLFRSHLAEEEQIIFPAIARLDADAKTAIAAEMVARRTDA